MESITIHIDTLNSAFEDQDELPRILTDLADDIRRGRLDELSGRLTDYNGNTCGKFEIEKGE